MDRIPSACGIRSKEVVSDTNCSYYLAINTQPAMVFSRLRLSLKTVPLSYTRARSAIATGMQAEAA
jgi:hypothetical protein